MSDPWSPAILKWKAQTSDFLSKLSSIHSSSPLRESETRQGEDFPEVTRRFYSTVDEQLVFRSCKKRVIDCGKTVKIEGDRSDSTEYEGSEFFDAENLEKTLSQLRTSPCKQATANYDIYSDEFSDISDIKADMFEDPEPKIIIWNIIDIIKTDAQELRLILESEHKMEHELILSGPWSRTPVELEVKVYFEGRNISENTTLVDAQHGHCIVYPECLISITRIIDYLNCERRATIANCVRSYMRTKSAIIGDILHKVFQTALASKDFSMESLRSSLADNLNAMREDIVQAWLMNQNDDLTEYYKILYKSCLDQLSNIYNIGLDYCACMFSQDKKFSSATISNHPSSNTYSSITIADTLEIEDNIWSARFGIRGKIDITSKSIIDGCERIVPIEIKTGKFNSYTARTHFAQVMFYTLLIQERYSLPTNPTSACIIYTESSSVILISPRRNEIVDLIITRNYLAANISLFEDSLELPDPRNDFTCQNCQSKPTCLTLLQVHIDKPQIFLTKNIDSFESSLKSFTKFWLETLQLEEKCIVKADFFLDMNNKGDVSNLRLISNINNVLRFKKKGNEQCNIDDLLDIPLLVSTESGQWALARGQIIEAKETEVSLNLEKRVTLNCMRNQDVSFRLDRDPIRIFFTTLRANVIHFAEATDLKRLREILIERKKPIFHTESSTKWKDFLNCKGITLNAEQYQAIELALSAKDYSLILGMPGTGKTTVIVSLILILMDQGKQILLGCHTHSAVDNVLLKLSKYCDKESILRLGPLDRMRPEIKPFCYEYCKLSFSTLEDYAQIYSTKKPQLIANTCLGSRHFMIANTRFDVCILDEAGQISLPAALGPIVRASKFILIGDPYQLAPLFKSRNIHSNTQSISESLFIKLYKAFPESAAELNLQYRMHDDIMYLSNNLIYNQKLRSNEARTQNEIIDFERLSEIHMTRCYNQRCAFNHLQKQSVIFFDLDSIPNAEHADSSSVSNDLEAKYISQMTHLLLESGIKAVDIGVITLYRSQMRLIQKYLPENVDCSTIDQFQGRDKQIIIVSFVRNNDDGIAGYLVKDSGRINVLLTRAISHLYMFGSPKTLKNEPIMAELFNSLEKKNWILRVNSKCEATFNSIHKKRQALSVMDT